MTSPNYSAEEALARRVPAWATPRRSWIAPVTAAVAAGGLTLALAASYYSPLVTEWEEHAEGLAADVAVLELDAETIRTERDAAQSSIAVVEGERDEAQSSIDAADARALDAESTLATAQVQLDEREAAVALAEAGVIEREAAVAGAEQQVADSTIREGRWTVGVDVEPGSYRVSSPVTGDRCYWAITTTGSNGDDIQSNDFGTLGNLSVRLSEGQDFETSDCGSWLKQ